jgi:cardiolipin synthase
METLVTSAVMSPATEFRWLQTGEKALGAMLAAIHGAQESIRLETYIYHTGETGEKFRDALTQACQRGVKVQVMVDAFGSANLPSTFWDSFVKAGGQFAWFNPLCLNRWCYRDHRKLLVCDLASAFIGGFNVADEYCGDGVTRGWRDLGLQLIGEPVKELAKSFDLFFARAAFEHKRLQQLRKAKTQVATGQNWQLLLSGPGRNDVSLKRTLARDLQQSRSVKIICAYFLPTWRLRKELMSVARRGGQVQLILAGKSDVSLSLLAGRRLYKSFLRAGVQIFEYVPQVLHAKLFIFDDVVYVGSANLDTRSLRINYELSLRIFDGKVAAEAREIFGNDLLHCRRIDAETWGKSRSLWSKLREDWAYFILARVDPYMARRQLKALR